MQYISETIGPNKNETLIFDLTSRHILADATNKPLPI